ncbi:hypothetical protein EC973_005480 [Apophysomyces ossiformis]|uniref:Histidine kinase/HSP90-like ATPase domain-containing protein n=1 Tax=Apophysomyces ossiformis TaxID=679940 RepID=A0A8H7BW90_9FUNG|nr:hypothetical protein EC973_005480 [Apophysomyces ossiformis]
MKVLKCSFIASALLLAILGMLATSASAEMAADDNRIHGLLPEQVEKLETEKFTFQTEISRLMSLIINSLYKSREIFLRELISNASDALDKIRFLSLTDPSALDSEQDLRISIAADPESRSLVITDTGVGMTRDQLKLNLGTVAKSGTSEFLRKLENNKDEVTQIGQFGVGFYSVFLVADKVVVASKSNDDDQYVWMSEAVDDFVIAKDPRGNTLGRGTQITLHLKEDAAKYLDDATLKSLVSKYSEFINFPIYVWSPHNRTVTKQEESDDEIEEQSLEDDTKKKQEETEIVHEWDLVNTQKPIWMRPSKDVSEEEYIEFYRSFTKHVSATPLGWTHYKGEGDIDFRSIIYIPPTADPNFFQNLAEKVRNVKLFVKRVFITDEVELFPKWLSFLKGIVDADDLPLNVARETLQKHRGINTISKNLVKKALDMFAQLSKNDEEKFGQFLKEYGNALKYGAIESDLHRKRIAKLLRFSSSYDPSTPGVSLESYISRVKNNQKSIFYMTGSSVQEIEQSPFLERLLARGYEVLYMVDPIDEILIQRMPGYNGKMFVNIAKGDLRFGDENEENSINKETDAKFEPLKSWLKDVLNEHIDKVVISKRLTKSPMAIVAADFGLTGHMERLMAAQGANKEQDAMLQMMKLQKKTLEINPSHPIIKGLLERVESKEVDSDTEEMVAVLYETTAIRSGYPLQNINGFSKRVEAIIRRSVGVSLEEEADVKVEVAAEKTEEEIQADEEIQKSADSLLNDEEDSDIFHDEL